MDQTSNSLRTPLYATMKNAFRKKNLDTNDPRQSQERPEESTYMRRFLKMNSLKEKKKRPANVAASWLWSFMCIVTRLARPPSAEVRINTVRSGLLFAPNQRIWSYWFGWPGLLRTELCSVTISSPVFSVATSNVTISRYIINLTHH